jgi:hypothetical protein
MKEERGYLYVINKTHGRFFKEYVEQSLLFYVAFCRSLVFVLPFHVFVLSAL